MPVSSHSSSLLAVGKRLPGYPVTALALLRINRHKADSYHSPALQQGLAPVSAAPGLRVRFQVEAPQEALVGEARPAFWFLGNLKTSLLQGSDAWVGLLPCFLAGCLGPASFLPFC